MAPLSPPSSVLVILCMALFSMIARPAEGLEVPFTAGTLKKAEELFMKGNTYLQEQDFGNAVVSYREALDANPKHADAWTNLGNAMSQAIPYSENQKKGLFNEAVKAYNAAIELNSEHCEAYFNLGVLYHTHNRLDMSIPNYEKAITIDPNHYDAISNLGSAKHKKGDLDGAVDLYQRSIEMIESGGAIMADKPGTLSMLHYLLGQALSSLPPSRCIGSPCPERAAQQFRTALRHNPENEEAKHALSALISDPKTTSASAAYVKSLFDEYAESFDKALVADLNYRAPQLLHQQVTEHVGSKPLPVFGVLFDAGCGTGLCGPLFRNMTKTLVGVDLSGEMIRKATERGIYDELVEGDLVASLDEYGASQGKHKGTYIDMVLAADVFVYIGALEQIFRASAASLRKGGIFAFTVERLETPELEGKRSQASDVNEAPVTQEDYERGWKLRFTGRFAHTRPYIAALAEEHGFIVQVHQDIVPRRDNGVDIQGHLLILEKR